MSDKQLEVVTIGSVKKDGKYLPIGKPAKFDEKTAKSLVKSGAARWPVNESKAEAAEEKKTAKKTDDKK